MVSVLVIGNRVPEKEKYVEIDDQEYHDTQRLRDSHGVWKFESSRLPPPFTTHLSRYGCK